MLEERLLKVLAAIYQSITKLHLGNELGVTRDEINSGILRIGFKAMNGKQIREDLKILIIKKLVREQLDGKRKRYLLEKRGIHISKNMLLVWHAFRDK